jgi:hypothetical protein
MNSLSESLAWGLDPRAFLMGDRGFTADLTPSEDRCFMLHSGLQLVFTYGNRSNNILLSQGEQGYSVDEVSHTLTRGPRN